MHNSTVRFKPKSVLKSSFAPTDIDECASDPCQNNGTCSDYDLGYNCSCEAGFTGGHCETGESIEQFTLKKQQHLLDLLTHLKLIPSIIKLVLKD